MKRFLLGVGACFMFLSVFAQAADTRVLLTIDGEPSTVEEFMYIYQKNNQTGAAQQSLAEYLDLFINFKLKVRAAEAAGLDTTKAFKQEFEKYRNQAVPKYMVDKEAEAAAIQKAYAKMLWDRKVSHIAIQCPADATPEQEAAAKEKIERARVRVTTGLPITVGKGKRAKVKPGVVEDFNTVAAEMSEDPSVAQNDGRIGWITAFRYIYPFEEATYSTPVGGVSEVFRSPFGFHILKVEEELPHREIHAAHIMKMTPRNDLNAAARAKFQIDSIYTLLQNGANFAETATANSEDRGSAQRGGDLDWFGRGQMVPQFEDVAFDMTQDSSISEPVLSQYGWHIIQFLGARGTADLADIREDVMSKIRRSEARHEIEDAFVNRLKAEYNFQFCDSALAPFYVLAEQYAITDDAFQAAASQWNAVLFTFADKTYTQHDFVSYLKDNYFSQQSTPRAIIDEKIGYFTARELRAHENAQLEKKYPEFRHLMAEYHDGILLFDISMQEVWDKAVQDTEGITRFFEENKANYPWDEPRFKGYVVYCKDKNTAKAAKRIIKSAEPDSVASYLNSRLNLDSVTYVKFEKGLWTKGLNAAVDKYGFKDKKAEYTPTETLPVVFTVGKVLKAPEEYTDERGKVTTDYQDYLEKEWIKALRAKYEVVVDEEVLKSL